MEKGASPAESSWYKLEGRCVHCGGGDFTSEYGPRHFVLCSCCNNWGTHVECFEKHKSQTLTEEFINSGSSWFCGKGCKEIAAFFETQNGVRMPVRGEAAEYTLELVRYDPDSRGARSVVDAAVKIFRDAFGRMTMPNGKDYIEMCCTAYESPDDEVGSDTEDEESTAVDFTGFRVAALRKGNQVVTVATLRLFGTQLAEMPYVATRPGFRRAGHCRRLLKGVEDMLRKLQVRWLVLPSVKSILTMWRYSFNFMPLTLEELASLEVHIISPDFGTVQLLKKRVWPQLAGGQRGSRGGRGSRTTAAAAATTVDSGADDKLAGQGGGRGRGGGATRGRGAGTAAGSSRGGQLQLKFGGGRRRRSRAAAAAASKADGSASDGDSLSCEGQPGDGVDGQQIAESQAAAEERAAAEAAWALFEQEKRQKVQHGSSSSDESDDPSSSDDDSDKPAAKRRGNRQRKNMGNAGADDDDYKGDASSSSDSSDSDSGLVSEDDDFQRISKHKLQQQQQKRGDADTPAATTTASGSVGTAAAATAAGGSAAESSSLPTQGERDAVLQQLRKEVEKAGGKLADGWTVRLVGKTPTGNWRTKYFVAPGGAPVFTGILAVKRHLGLAPPLAGPRAAPPGAAGAAAGGPCNKRQRTTGPDAGGSVAGDGSGAGIIHYPHCVAKRLQELRMGRARRRHMSDATLGVGLADAVKTFYTTAVTQLVNSGSHQETLELQQQVESLQAQLDDCYSTADATTTQLSSCRAELAMVQAERNALQADQTARKNQLAERNAVIASQRALINSLTQQLSCSAAAAVETPATTAAESPPLADELKSAAAAGEPAAAAEAILLVGERHLSAATAPAYVAETDLAITQLRQQLEATTKTGAPQPTAAAAPLLPPVLSSITAVGPAAATDRAAPIVTPATAAVAPAPLLPPLLAGNVAAEVTAGDTVAKTQQGSTGLGHPVELWGCQDVFGFDNSCLDMQDVGNSAADGLGLGLTHSSAEPTGIARLSSATVEKPLDCAAAACQPCSIDASQQCGTQTLQFSEDQTADGACDPLPPAHEPGCLAATTQQAEQEQQQEEEEEEASLAVLPARVEAKQVAAEAPVAAGDSCTIHAATIAAAAQTVEASTTASALHRVNMTTAPAETDGPGHQKGAAAATRSVEEAPLALLAAAAAAAELGHAAAEASHSSAALAAITLFQQPAAKAAAAAAGGACTPLSTPAAYTLNSEPPAVQQSAAVAAADRQPGTATPAAIADIKGSTPAAAVAAAAPLGSSQPPAGPTAAAAAPASGGSRLSDSFLSGLLPDVVGCLLHSPAFKQATAQQQQQQQLHHCEQQQHAGSPEVEQSLDHPKVLADAAAAGAHEQLQDCTSNSPVASAAAAVAVLSPTAGEPGSDEGSYNPADMELSSPPNQPPYATSQAAAVVATATPDVAHMSVKSSGSSSHRRAANSAWIANQDGSTPAGFATTYEVHSYAPTGIAAASAEGSQKPAKKRQKIHHPHHSSSSSRPHRRAYNAVLDLFGDVALLEGLQELRSPGSSKNQGGSSSSDGSGSCSGNSAGDSGSGGVQGPGSGSSVLRDANPRSASNSQVPPAVAQELRGSAGHEVKDAGENGAVVSERETTPVEDGCADIHAVASETAQQQQQHTPSSDGGDSGLPGALAEMFENLAADMARDGMLPAGNDTAPCRAAHALSMQDTQAGAGASIGSSSPKARAMASVLSSVANTAAGVGVGKTAGSLLSAAAGIMGRATGVAVGGTVSGIAASDGMGLKQSLTKAASMVVDNELVAAGSMPVGTEENFAAALDTAALFAFAGDME